MSSTESQPSVLKQLWNVSRTLPVPRRLLQQDELYFADYIPPARDAISLPKYMLYILIGALLVIVGTYGITSHLIKDLFHDLADWLLGPDLKQEEEEMLESSGLGDRVEDRNGKRGKQSIETAEEKKGFKLSVITS